MNVPIPDQKLFAGLESLHPDIASVQEDWDLIDGLLGGARGMRALIRREGARKYLPQEPSEDDDAYRRRLERTSLYEAFADSVRRLADKPFSRALRVVSSRGDSSAIPEFVSNLVTNADGANRSLHAIANVALRDAVARGKSHFLVDLPPVAPRRASDEKLPGQRPTISNVRARDLLGWRWGQVEGVDRLVQVRIAEAIDIDSEENDFEVIRLPAIRILDSLKHTWRLAVRSPRGWYIHAEGEYTLPFVPLVPYFTEQEGKLGACPPMMALASMNLSHYQSGSDQANILRFARVAMIFLSGLSREDEEKASKKRISWNELWTSTKADADMKFVEHGGRAIECGERDLERKERQMEVLGVRPAVERVGDMTATGQRIAEGQSITRLQSWIRDLERALLDCVKLAAQLTNQTIPDDIRFDVYSDFAAVHGDSSQSDLIVRSFERHLIDQRTALSELKRRSMISDETDIEAVVERTKLEKPEPPAFPGV